MLAVKPKKTSIEEIEQITQNIHTQKQAANTEGVQLAPKAVEPKTAAKQSVVAQTATDETDELGDRIKRISVHAPLALYIKAKTKTTIKGVSMMAYILELMEKDLNN